MNTTQPRRAARNRPKRLREPGMARFEVLGRDAGCDLMRSAAKRLAGNDPDSARIRAAVSGTNTGELPGKGGIPEALRRSPRFGADLNLKRQQANRAGAGYWKSRPGRSGEIGNGSN